MRATHMPRRVQRLPLTSHARASKVTRERPSSRWSPPGVMKDGGGAGPPPG